MMNETSSESNSIYIIYKVVNILGKLEFRK